MVVGQGYDQTDIFYSFYRDLVFFQSPGYAAFLWLAFWQLPCEALAGSHNGWQEHLKKGQRKHAYPCSYQWPVCAAPAAGKVTSSCCGPAHWRLTQKQHNASTGHHNWELNSSAGTASQSAGLTKLVNPAPFWPHFNTLPTPPPPVEKNTLLLLLPVKCCTVFPFPDQVASQLVYLVLYHLLNCISSSCCPGIRQSRKPWPYSKAGWELVGSGVSMNGYRYGKDLQSIWDM